MRSLTPDLDHILAHTGLLWEDLRGQRIFLTGGTGFVGTWLIESFLHCNRVLDLNASLTLLTRNPAGFRAKAPALASQPGIQLLLGDAVSFPFPDGDFPFVIHASTERQFAPTAEQPAGMFDGDLGATRRVLEFARTHATRRLLFTSSGAAYGKQPPNLTHISEDYPGAPATTDPASAYGEAKRVAEWLCVMHGHQYGFEPLLARLFAFVGPRLPLDLNFAIGNFIRNVLEGNPIRISGDGTPERSYLYAADLAIWLWTILFRAPPNRLYNVGSGEAINIAQLARAVADATVPATPIEVAGKPVPGTGPARYVPDTTRAEQELNLRSLVPLPEAIRRTYDWYRP